VVSISTVRLLESLRRHSIRPPADVAVNDETQPVAARLPDPSKAPQARGSWEQAALTNIAITEKVKHQIGTVTPPWLK
jgi:hypothetical protein